MSKNTCLYIKFEPSIREAGVYGRRGGGTYRTLLHEGLLCPRCGAKRVPTRSSMQEHSCRRCGHKWPTKGQKK